MQILIHELIGTMLKIMLALFCIWLAISVIWMLAAGIFHLLRIGRRLLFGSEPAEPLAMTQATIEVVVRTSPALSPMAQAAVRAAVSSWRTMAAESESLRLTALDQESCFLYEIRRCVQYLDTFSKAPSYMYRSERVTMKLLLGVLRGATDQIVRDPSHALQPVKSVPLIEYDPSKGEVEDFLVAAVLLLQQVLPTTTRSLDALYAHRPALRQLEDSKS
jgi:hypothetical protein